MKKTQDPSRSYTMSRVKSKDTGPEMLVRKWLFSRGYRYRLHNKDLPGNPDIVMKSHNKIIFVHGCFWHSHSCPRGKNVPASNLEYWVPKLQRNAERDKLSLKSLKQMGWKVLIIWECDLKKESVLDRKLRRFLKL